MRRFEIAAVEAVVWLAMQKDTVAKFKQGEIAAAVSAPARYLEPLLQKLTKAGILVGRQGPRGGYRFSRREGVSVFEIFAALRSEDTPVGFAGRYLTDMVESFYRKTLVEDLVVEQVIKEQANA